MPVIVLIGDSALGRFIAAHLVFSGHDVWWVVDDAADSGRPELIVEHRGDDALPASRTQPRLELRQRIHRIASLAQLPGSCLPEWVLVADDGDAVFGRAGDLATAIPSPNPIVIIGDRVGSPQRAATIEAWDPGRVFGVVSDAVVALDRQGAVRHFAGGILTIGHLRNEFGLADPLAAMLRAAGFRVFLPLWLQPMRWLTALTEGLIADALWRRAAGSAAVYADPAIRAEVLGLLDEAVAIVNADQSHRWITDRCSIRLPHRLISDAAGWGITDADRSLVRPGQGAERRRQHLAALIATADRHGIACPGLRRYDQRRDQADG